MNKVTMKEMQWENNFDDWEFKGIVVEIIENLSSKWNSGLSGSIWNLSLTPHLIDLTLSRDFHDLIKRMTNLNGNYSKQKISLCKCTRKTSRPLYPSFSYISGQGLKIVQTLWLITKTLLLTKDLNGEGN